MFHIPTKNRETEPLRFSPDGNLLMAISKSYLYFWETKTGQLIDWMHLDTAVPGLAISPDNTTLAIGDEGKAQLWDISAVRDLSSQAALNPVTPPPTATPWQSDLFPTPTPIATQMVSISEKDKTYKESILPENATKVQEIAHFGNGLLEEIIWSFDDQIPTQTLVSAGSLGIITYGTKPLTVTQILPTSPWMDTVISLPNGEILASGVISQTVQVLNISTGKILLEIPGSGPVKLNADGTLLVYGDRGGNLQVHNLIEDRPITTLFSMYASQLPVFSPDDQFVAAVNGYETNLGAHHFVRIWDLKTGQIVNALGVSDAPITDLSFSADGNFLIGASGGAAWVWDLQNDGTPQIFSIYNPEIDGNLTLYHQRITAAAINTDNRIVAIGDSERNIWLYGRAYKNKICLLTGHAAPIASLRFSPDGDQLLSSDIDGNLIIWEVATGRILENLSTQAGLIQGLMAGIDGSIFGWKNNTALTLEPSDARLVASTAIYTGTILTISPTGDRLGVSHRLHMSVWDASTGDFIQKLEGEAGDPFIEYHFEGIILRGFYKAAFSPDGNQLTTYAPGETWSYNLGADNQFQQNDFQEGDTYSVLDDLYGATATSLDGKWSVKTSRWHPTTLYFNELDNKINEMTFPDEKEITALTFSPDSQLVAVGFADGSIELIDVGAWKSIYKLAGHKGTVNELVFSIDGSTLASASRDGTIRFWGLQ